MGTFNSIYNYVSTFTTSGLPTGHSATPLGTSTITSTGQNWYPSVTGRLPTVMTPTGSSTGTITITAPHSITASHTTPAWSVIRDPDTIDDELFEKVLLHAIIHGPDDNTRDFCCRSTFFAYRYAALVDKCHHIVTFNGVKGDDDLRKKYIERFMKK